MQSNVPCRVYDEVELTYAAPSVLSWLVPLRRMPEKAPKYAKRSTDERFVSHGTIVFMNFASSTTEPLPRNSVTEKCR
jgi:hypothetical protein